MSRIKPVPRRAVLQRTAALAAGAVAASRLTGTPLGPRSADARDAISLTNVSYDPTREFYREFNTAFARSPGFAQSIADRPGAELAVQMSHGGSAAQARAVIGGLDADVVTLALAQDIDAIAAAGRLATDWQTRLPENACPYTSTVVFLVKKGNPKQITDWDDLTRVGLRVIIPNPKTSGVARWNFLAAYAWALDKNAGNEASAIAFMRRFFKNTPALDAGSRAATITFTNRGIGDVLVTWENEAYLSLAEASAGVYEIVVPPRSILAEPPVAVVDSVVDRRGTRRLAEAYLRFLYEPEAQEMCARHFFRPRLAAVREKYAQLFPSLSLFTIDETFGGWAEAQRRFFADGAIFDQIMRTGK